jgi:hypothetical protein
VDQKAPDIDRTSASLSREAPYRSIRAR